MAGNRTAFVLNAKVSRQHCCALRYLITYFPPLVAILGRYPLSDHAGFALPSEVAMFCLPTSANVELWPLGVHHPLPVFSTFVLTSDMGVKIYGAAIIFYDDFDEKSLTEAQQQSIGLQVKGRPAGTLHQNKSICFLSRWPFFDAMRSLLLYIYRISVSGPQPVPIERLVYAGVHTWRFFLLFCNFS